MAYRGLSKKLLDKFKVDVGDEVILSAKSGRFEGILMPRSALGDEYHIVIKLENGYNVGVKVDGSEDINKKEAKKDVGAFKKKSITYNPKLPLMTILHTGGTIASRIDYRTGGVYSAFTPEEILELFPELEDITNLSAHLVSNMFSEDIEMAHLVMICKHIKKEIDKGTKGIVITHGTDTMGVSSAALSFMAQNLPIPAVFVGSQRSSDRGSSDAKMNLLCASQFAIKSDFAGVGLCMHAQMADDYCFVHEGTKVRKMHTSRRDTFRSINQFPWAKVWQDGKIEFIRKDYCKRDPNREVVIKDKYEKKVFLLKTHLDLNPKLIDFLTEQKYKGIVLEGTGLGHAPINVLDEYTKHHGDLFNAIKRFNDQGGITVMTSACLYGRINMNVYSTGRDLQNIGVIPSQDMFPETALVKLKWVLGQTKDLEEAKKLFLTNIAGEITERTDSTAFIPQWYKDEVN